MMTQRMAQLLQMIVRNKNLKTKTMKTNILTAAAVSFLTMTTFAQKDQVKNAEDALDDGNYAEAKAQLKVAEANLSGLNDKWQENFYLYKGKAYSGGNPTAEDMKMAAEAFQKAVDMGSDEATEGLTALKNNLIQSAISDQNKEDFEAAADKLYTSYDLSKQDTIYLYYAANNLVQAQKYDKAANYLEMLNELDYDGSGEAFTAVNVETGERENLGSKQQMDLMIKTNQYKEPEVEKIPSKKGEIAALIARIYINQEKYDKAIAAMDKAKATNPDDMGLLQAEANMYYQMGEKDKAREILEEVAANDPSDPATFNNIGLMYAEIEDTEKAIEFYKKALDADSEFNEARINLIAAKLSKERSIIDEMNGLGMSKKDNARYDELDAERKELYKEVLPFLEKAMEVDPENTDIVKTAMNLYTNLGNQEKADELKAKL
ncbi:secreted protein containing tetratricopeptide repeats [Christiangramia forsetii KT0803]|uniref:Secreted protein containing tetratricopeptide repeats n=2 Tax=Christiangramia forsetii TaxID=411153 RepID=A0M1I3_CHRFK|nr:secreted protein containing tetratricopeptide repeats [Christiangramia forsetii KT0803]